MPLWDLNELELLRSLVYPHIERLHLEKAFMVAGGVPRYVLCNKDPTPLISQAVASCKIDECWRAIGLAGSERDSSSKIIHMDVNESYTNYTCIFGSKWIGDQVLFLKLADTSIPLHHYFNPQDDALQYISGYLYESWAVKFLTGKHTLQIVSKNGFQKREISTPGGLTMFSSYKEWNSPHTLYIPTGRTFPAIDILLSPGCLFQVTKSTGHKPLPSKDLINYINQLKSFHFNDHLEILLITIVPEDNPHKYGTPLSYSNLDMQLPQFEKTYSITQYFLPLPYPTIDQLKAFKTFGKTSTTAISSYTPFKLF